MRWVGLLVGLSGWGAACALAQSPDEASTRGHETVNAVLESSLDARKAKSGQIVRAKTVETGGLTVLPEETTLLGEVTHARARKGKAQPSEIAFTFRRALLKDGTEIPIHATVQAVAASGSARLPRPGPPDLTANMPAAGANTEAVGGVDVRGFLVPESQGVFGLPGVQLLPRGLEDDVALSSGEYNVHLDSGTRLLVSIKEPTQPRTSER
jgi:hypothetical protein